MFLGDLIFQINLNAIRLIQDELTKDRCRYRMISFTTSQFGLMEIFLRFNVYVDKSKLSKQLKSFFSLLKKSCKFHGYLPEMLILRVLKNIS